ncbi:hypothetical protein C8T65DRAFT_755303 [Cerioporus squamosus]|nr:hypothetical protein C8T65DRAFT_755303 [Cerioporus squamosus]
MACRVGECGGMAFGGTTSRSRRACATLLSCPPPHTPAATCDSQRNRVFRRSMPPDLPVRSVPSTVVAFVLLHSVPPRIMRIDGCMSAIHGTVWTFDRLWPQHRQFAARVTDKPDSQVPTRDSDLWLLDGNVVIVAQDTAFRIHRGLLSRHSEVFNGLFALAEPDEPAAAELCDGCPVVRIPDSVHDFRYLLHALYDGLSSMESVEERTKFSMYAALARLGDKYGLPHIFAAAIKWLSTIFTDTYSVWHDLWTEHRSMSGIMSDRGVNPFEAANLFRVTGQDRMRPTALFMCCQLDVPLMVGGLPRADGVVEVLSREDLQRCLQARIQFTAEMTTSMLKFYFHSRGNGITVASL